MKLYFPTSSLNFNDIFSTESISPKSFYKKRSFGTKRHFKTELAFDEKCTTLFSKIPNFKLVKGTISEYEEYPIVFELDIDPKQYEMINFDNEIYMTQKTIYFRQCNIKILFFSATELNTILAKSNLVNETKLVQKYINMFKVIENSNLHEFKTPNNISQSISVKNVIDDEMEKDSFFNSVKGLYYAYVSKRYTHIYKEKNDIYKLNLDGVKKIKDVLNVYEDVFIHEDKIDEYTINSKPIIDLTRIAKVNADLLLKKSRKELCDVIKLFNIFNLHSENDIDLNKEDFTTTEEMIIYKIIIECIIKNPKSKVGDIYKEEIVNLINTIGKKIAQEFGGKSIYRNDFILIYQRIVKGIFEIDINLINSNVLKNFMAFILKYDNIEEFEKYLQYKKIENEYLAYSFLGGFLGFSALSKTITNELLSCKSEELFETIDSIMNDFRNSIWNNKKQNINICENYDTKKTCTQNINYPNNVQITIQEKTASNSIDENHKIDKEENKFNVKKGNK